MIRGHGDVFSGSQFSHDTGPKVPRCLVGECKTEHRLGRQSVAYLVHYARRHHMGFAGPGPGHHQQGSGRVGHRRTLCFGEVYAGHTLRPARRFGVVGARSTMGIGLPCGWSGQSR